MRDIYGPDDAPPVIDALHTDLGGYLNQPVSEILARLGQAAPGDQQPTPGGTGAEAPTPTPAPAPSSGAPAPASSEPAGASSPVEPSQMIKPVTDALGLLGSGEFAESDPTQTLDGISQALDQARGAVEQALAQVAGIWQGEAADAAQTATVSTLGAAEKVATQAVDLRRSLTAAASAVKQAEARLIEIINVFWSKIAAIGPSIIFPWGMAAAVAAAVEAVTESVEVITETQGTLSTEAANVTSAGAPVDVASVGALGSAAESLQPALNAMSGVMSSVMGGAAGSPGSFGDVDAGPAVGATQTENGPHVPPASSSGGGGSGAAGGGRGSGGVPSVPMAARPVTPAAPVAPVAPAATGESMRGGGGMPMAGTGPIAGRGNANRDSTHSTAAFLHTTDHDDFSGDLSAVAPAVIGERELTMTTDAELRI